MRYLIGSVSLLVLLASPAMGPLHADRGGVPFRRGAVLSVPRQQAIIAWNGHEETLILGTDRRASIKVKVLEVLPLPGEPTIWKADAEVFDTARILVAAKLQEGRRRMVAAKGFAPAAMAGGVTKHRRIGAHDIRVVKVSDPDEFVRWSAEMLRKWGAEMTNLPASFRAVMNRYLHDGYQWFVYDIVELGPETQQIEAVGYRFKSPQIYFPLRVTTLDAGDSSVELMVITDQNVEAPASLGAVKIVQPHRPVELTARDQGKIDSHLAGMFPGRAQAKLATWELNAKTTAFVQDLMVPAMATR